jgi:hypothetical protein
MDKERTVSTVRHGVGESQVLLAEVLFVLLNFGQLGLQNCFVKD